MTSTKPPSGTRDLLPADVRRREYVTGVIRRVYERYGFEPLETPAFENIDTLLGKYGEEGNKLIFKILRRGEHEAGGQADLALRYDLTVPLARVVAQHQHVLPKFFKRYQIQQVWRADRPAKGRFREFYQCDIDTIGSTSPVVEAEQMAAVAEVLAELGFGNFSVLLNHREILTGLLDVAPIPRDQHETALVALDKWDRIGEDGVRAEFAERGIAPQGATRLFDMLREFYAPAGSTPSVNADRLVSLARYLQGTPSESAVENIRAILVLVDGTPAEARVLVEPRLARGLSYYTGAIMEIAVPDLAGSLGGGGRYDHLIGMFLGREIPACGFSLGLERLIVVMTERGLFEGKVAAGALDVMVALWPEQLGEAMALASELRRAGLRVEVYPDADRLAKQFKYAAGHHVPFVAVVGEDERAKGEVSLKDLRTGEQNSVPAREAAAFVSRQLGPLAVSKGR